MVLVLGLPFRGPSCSPLIWGASGLRGLGSTIMYYRGFGLGFRGGGGGGGGPKYLPILLFFLCFLRGVPCYYFSTMGPETLL